MSKKKKHNLQWIEKTLELKNNHNWKGTPGHRIFVAGRGAVRFDIPEDWHFEPKDNSFRFLDKKPPDDDCGLEVSYNLLPPGNWSELPLVELLEHVVRDDSRDVIDRGKIIQFKRQTARVVWTELKFIDTQEDQNREAYSRICIGIGSGVQCLITFEFWADDTERCTPVWDTVMNTLVLGLFISDPRTGFALPD
jgi:hypothetical protein